MTVDLTALDAANKALQNSPTVAKATKDYGAAATAAIRALNGDTPPPPPGGLWQWDAARQPLDPNSASRIQAFQSYAVAKGCYFVAAVAWQNAPAGTTAYTIPTSQAGGSLVAPIPLGTQPGCTNDRSLAVRDSFGKEYDLGNANYSTASRQILSAAGGAYVPADSVGETGPGANSSNAAKFPLRSGPITPADIAAGKISHALHCSFPNVGPAPNRYPSLATVGYPANSGLPLGSWLRLDPAIAVSSLGLDSFQSIVATCLQDYGMFVRDINPSNFSLYGTDQVNQGGNAVDWPAVGVTLTSKTSAGVPYALPFSASFPWAHLQLLVPPTP